MITELEKCSILTILRCRTSRNPCAFRRSEANRKLRTGGNGRSSRGTHRWTLKGQTNFISISILLLCVYNTGNNKAFGSLPWLSVFLFLFYLAWNFKADTMEMCLMKVSRLKGTCLRRVPSRTWWPCCHSSHSKVTWPLSHWHGAAG